MRKWTILVVLLPVIFFALLTVTSCKKSGGDVVVSNKDTTKTDTLVSNGIYTIDSTGVPAPGIILAAPFDETIIPSITSPGLLLVMDQNGKILKQQTTPGPAFSLNRWTINGQTRYTYLVNDPAALRLYGVDEDAGYAVIADSNLNQLQRINFTPYGEGLFQTGQALDVHDFILISDSDYITLSYDIKYVNNIPSYLHPAAKVSVVAPVIEEVNHGSVVWSWDGSADTSFYANSVEGNAFSDSVTGQDYLHMNSLFIDPRDNNLICSMRNQDQVIKINRKTGAIIWRLGGKNSDFPLLATQVFLRQHHATLTDNNQTLLLFDDGEQTLRPYSRVVEFQLDEVGKVVTNFKSFTIPETFSKVMGSVQKIGAEYFIGGGSANYILEVNATTGQKVMEFKSSQATYRAYKY
ncbi:MAG TPA: aryl-sulfate sulfotransferase [Puia sp.]|nr:aryl-sulfate sulfotransferase [Puia sp.]